MSKTVDSMVDGLMAERNLLKRLLAAAYSQLDQWEATYGENALRDASQMLAERQELRRQLATLRTTIPNDIRAELVCCDIYDLDAGTGRAGKTHAICFWGEAAARIAEDRISATVEHALPVTLDPHTPVTFLNQGEHQYVMTTWASRCARSRCDCGQIVVYMRPYNDSDT